MTVRPGTIEYCSRETPDAIARIDGARTFTFREWNDTANRVANALAVGKLGDWPVR